jgi:DNA-binding IclR family transcriptional regulator
LSGIGFATTRNPDENDLIPDTLMAASSTVLKALDLLSVLAGRVEGCRLPELMQALNQPRTNVVRLLEALQIYGLVTRTRRHWHTTPAFHCWAAPPSIHDIQRRRYRPVLEAVAHATGELVLLGLHEGNGIVHIDYIESDHQVRVAPAPDTRHQLSHNALGKLVLSRRHDIAARIRNPRLNAELAEIRRTGIAWNREETVRGMIALATPGFRNTPTEPMVAVAWPASRFSERKGREAVRSIHRALAANLRSSDCGRNSLRVEESPD